MLQIFQYQIGNTLVNNFYPLDEPLLMPEGTEMVHDGKVWGLYVNYDYDMSFIVNRAFMNGIDGWRVRVMPGISKLSYAREIVRGTCGTCLEERFGVRV